MSDIQLFQADTASALSLPYADEGVRAGFPSPAQDFMAESIDLNRDLIRHTESTFYARVAGNSLEDAVVQEGDILVVDKSLDVRDGDMAVCCVEGEFTLKFIEMHPDHWLLRPANPEYQPLRIDPDDDFAVWGVVTYIIHAVRGNR